MTPRRSPRGRLVAAAVVAVLLATQVGGRLQRALETPALGTGVRTVDALPVATDLDDPPPPDSIGVTGPVRQPDDPSDAARTRRTWFAADRWWGVFAGASGGLHIWAWTGRDGPWVDTGTQVDDRAFAEPWVLADGTSIVVTTTGTRDYREHALRVNRFRWDDARRTWVPFTDFPVQVTDTGAPGTRSVLDGSGRLWLARLVEGRVLVARSDDDLLGYTSFATLPGGAADGDVGGFDLVAGADAPTVIWRSATRDRLSVATPEEGTWRRVDHAVHGIGGIGAVTATPAGPTRPDALVVLASSTLPARTDNDQDPSILLAVLRGDRIESSVVAVAADRLREPRLVIDPDAGRAHVFAVLDPPDAEPGVEPGPTTVVDKEADLDDLAFATGTGRPVLRSPMGTFDAPSVPTTTGTGPGLLVLASGDGLADWHTAQEGGPSVAGTPAGPADDTLFRDTFDLLDPGGPTPRAWRHDGDGPPTFEVAADGPGRRALVLTNRDGGPAASVCRAIPLSAAEVISVAADVRLDGLGTADAQLLTVKGAEGTLASVRLTRTGLLAYSGPTGRVDQVPVDPARPLRVTIRVDRARGTADLAVAGADGTTLFQAADRPLLTAVGAGPDEVCAKPPPGNPASSLTLADVVASRG